MATKAPATLLPLLLAGGIGFGAGALGSASFGGQQPPPPTAAPTDLTPLLEELRALRAELRREPGLAAQPPAAVDGGRRDAVAPPAPDTDRLLTITAQLTAAVETLAQRAEVLGTRQAAQRGLLQDAAGTATRDVRALLAVRDSVQQDFGAAQAQWMFVPAAEVLRRFGRPSQIGSGNGGTQWQYEGSVGDESYWVGFTIVDGMVSRVE